MTSRPFLSSSDSRRFKGVTSIYGSSQNSLQQVHSVPDLTSWATQLESVHVRCLEMITFSSMRVGESRRRVGAINLSSLLSNEGDCKAGLEAIEAYSSDCETHLASVYLAVLTDRIKCGLPVDPSVSEARSVRARTLIEGFAEDHQQAMAKVGQAIDEAYRRRGQDVRWWNPLDQAAHLSDWFKTEHNERLRKQANDRFALVAELFNAVDGDLVALEKMFQLRRDMRNVQLTIDVQLNSDGEVDACEVVGPLGTVGDKSV